MSTKPNLHDGEARLCAVENSSSSFTGYMYDAEGRRIAKGFLGSLACPSSSGFSALSNQYLLGPGGEQVTELTGNSTIAWYHSNVFAGGKLLATYNSPSGTAELHFHLTDWLGSRRVQTNALGEVEGYYTSLPFGDDLTPNGSDATEHHFTGKERDTVSGNDYFGARYYAATLARFLSADWAASAAPVPYAKMGDPQTLNLYAYVGNNPLVAIDAYGHAASGNPRNFLDGKSWWQRAEDGVAQWQDSLKNDAQNATQDVVHGLSNLFHGHSWNYGTRLSVTTTDAPQLAQLEQPEPNETIALGADGTSLFSAIPDLIPGGADLALGIASGGISSMNDPSCVNLTLNGIGVTSGVVSYLAEGTIAGAASSGVGFGVGVGGVVWDLDNGFVNHVMAPMLNAAPPQMIPDDEGHMILNPGLSEPEDYMQQ